MNTRELFGIFAKGLNINKKEVKKMSRPYLEVKIIEEEKVKGKRELEMNPRGAGKSTKYWSNFSNEVLERLQINAKRELGRRQAGKAHKQGERSGGNNVNGENLDKIKFPCFCSYVSFTGKKHHALLIKDRNNGEYKYKLLRISQDNGESIFLSSDSLKKLIRKWDIHILKAKIILFEEKNK